MRPPAPIFPVLTLAAALLPAASSALTLDSFTSALPPNPCLSLSNQPVVFSGPFCDGAACPPAPLATCGTHEVHQTGMPGVFAGTERMVSVSAWQESGTVSARIEPGASRLHATLDLATEAAVGLSYGTPGLYTQDPDALNLDLLAMHAVGVGFIAEGTMSPAQPLFVQVVFLSDTPGDPPRPSAYADRLVTEPGAVLIPLGDFVPYLGFTMSDVDDIEFWFSDCTDPDNGCPDVAFQPMEFSIGPIEIVPGPTATQRTTWGRLKTLYR